MGSVKKAAKSAVTAAGDLVGSVAKGDFGGAADAVTRVFTYGTVGTKKGGIVNAKDIMGNTPQIKDTTETKEVEKEADKTSKQRQALFMTQGDILGEEVESVGKKKRGTILGN